MSEPALDGRVAVVTGGGRNIGRAIALALAAEGAAVVVGARSDRAAADAVAAEIEAAGGRAMAHLADVADEAQVAGLADAAVAAFGRIDILVNNAAITRDQLQMRMKRADWDAVLQTNLTGTHLCCQAVIPGMLKQRSGRIINLTSVVAQTGNPGQANYIASKAGVIGLTKALAVEIASRGITVNAVAPGFIDTPMTEGLSDKAKEAMRERIPLGRMGTGRDVAAAVAFLAGDGAGYITGHVINVNGGLFMG